MRTRNRDETLLNYLMMIPLTQIDAATTQNAISEPVIHDASIPDAASVISPQQRHALVLRAWEAINTERDLPSVLAAVADVLVPVVPFAAIGIVSFEGERHDLYDAHIVGVPRREGESLQQFMLRREFLTPKVPPLDKPLIPYDLSPQAMLRMQAGIPAAVDDLLEKERWYEHEFKLAEGGIRSYASVPLVARAKVIGVASFTRIELMPFTPEQLSILSDVSRAVAVAVANALANEEIRRLRDQLEAENIALRTQLGESPWFEDIVGDSAALRRVLESVEQVATTDATVLITGETGTGKELIARAIHRRSARAHGPMIVFNCAAIPDTLLASELFGHERGAFTGAVQRRRGRFEQAHGGTLFLDEIGDLSPEMQVVLLRVLQEREFERVGGNQTLHVDVRIVAATNRNLAEEVRAGRFRSDLYYRLNVFAVRVPPLRDRPEDIAPLAAHFAAKHGERLGRAISRIDRRTIGMLESYNWPGNVRELENAIERGVILSRAGTLRVDREDLAPLAGGLVPVDLDAQMTGQEREMIKGALRASRGRVAGETGAAKRLGIPASTLEFRIKRLGIDKFAYRSQATKTLDPPEV